MLLLAHFLLIGAVAAVAALAVVPAGAGLFLLIGFDLLDGFGAVKAMAAVQGIQLILLDDVDEFVGIVLVLGIAAIPEPLCPTAVVGHFQLIEDAVTGTLEELGVIEEGILGGAILAVTHTVAQ